jgi:phosphatidylethanolamine N-methyltransferase
MEEVLSAMFAIAASPTVWNIVARNEYRHHTLEQIFGGKYKGCYALALWIFVTSLLKDYMFSRALDANPDWILLPYAAAPQLYVPGTVCLAVGTTLVVAAFARLGVTGTYLGDYFGILMKEKVTGFPFNLLENPMYFGATLNFVGLALQKNSLMGILLAVWVYLVYEVATRFFENPFTNMIYREASARRNKKG